MTTPNFLVPEAHAVDALHRVLVPVEDPNGFFATTDGRVYRRVPTSHLTRSRDQIVRVLRKVKGKAARAADKLARRKAREKAAKVFTSGPPPEAPDGQ